MTGARTPAGRGTDTEDGGSLRGVVEVAGADRARAIIMGIEGARRLAGRESEEAGRGPCDPEDAEEGFEVYRGPRRIYETTSQRQWGGI